MFFAAFEFVAWVYMPVFGVRIMLSEILCDKIRGSHPATNPISDARQYKVLGVLVLDYNIAPTFGHNFSHVVVRLYCT